MKLLRSLVLAAAAGAALFSLSPAVQAHGWGGPRASIYFGFGGPAWPGYWGPRYGYPYGYGYGYGYPYAYPYAYPPTVVVPGPVYPPVVVEQQAPAYVERDTPPPAAQAQQWWYWCGSAKAYYPYVKSCAEGWQRVAPQPVN